MNQTARSRYSVKSSGGGGDFAPPTLDDIEAALQYLDPDVPRDDWVQIGMSLKSELGDGGFDIFDAWSGGGSTYKADDVKTTWRSIKPNGGVRIATLFHHAREAGWQPEKKRTPEDIAKAQKERDARLARREAEEQQAAQARHQAQEYVALHSTDRWEQATAADPEHGYLKAKGVQPHNVRQEGDNLLLPMFDEHDRIWSVQTISPEGEKRFPKDSRKRGLYFPILGDTPGVVICEGFATGASIQEATGYFVAVAFDCGNLQPVAEIIRAKLPDQKIIIAADNDKAGIAKATQAAEAINGLMVMPEQEGQDFNDVAQAGGDVKAVIDNAGKAASRYPFILFGDVAPVLDTTALVQGLIKPESFIVTYGESGSGKTFDALHRDACIASGTPYFGRATESGLVVYLAAEGGNSTRNRVAAYRRELFRQANFALVPYSMDLLNIDGDVEGLIHHIQHLEDLTGKGCIKVTQDTLARAMPGGNENSGEDMGLLVSNADRIRHAICCAFEFIHHAGKDSARGARGHSSLKAATDTELEVTLCNGMHFVRPTKQRDFPLGDEFAFTLRQVEIGTDQDGEPVTTCVPVVADCVRQSNAQQPTKQEQLAIQTLEEAFRLHQVIPPKGVIDEPSNRINIGRNVCPVSAWRQIYIARKLIDRTKADSAERTFRRHAETLQVKGIIKIFEEWVWFLKG